MPILRTRCLPRAVFLDGQVEQFRRPAPLDLHEAHAGHEGFDDVNLLQRRNNQQLQIELLKEL